jgi:hypothetical protein
MVARKVQGWTWEAIAEEAGITPSAAIHAVKRRQEAVPIQFNADPVRVIEDIFTAYQLSIGDFEAIAAEATMKDQLAVAVGAKKGANDARDKVLTLLQLTGRLPEQLGSLRHLIDLRQIAVRMLDAMDRFDEAVAKVEMTSGQAAEVFEASGEVRRTFEEVLGIEHDEEPPAIEAAAS